MNKKDPIYAKKSSDSDLQGIYEVGAIAAFIFLGVKLFNYLTYNPNRIKFAENLKMNPEAKDKFEVLFYQVQELRNSIEKAKISKNWQELQRHLINANYFKNESIESNKSLYSYLDRKYLNFSLSSISKFLNFPKEFYDLYKVDNNSIQELFKTISVKDNEIIKDYDNLIKILNDILDKQTSIGITMQNKFEV